MIKKELCTKKEYKQILNEISILTKLDHPNITTIYEFWEDDKRIFMVLDIVKGEQLMDEVVEHGIVTE